MEAILEFLYGFSRFAMRSLGVFLGFGGFVLFYSKKDDGFLRIFSLLLWFIASLLLGWSFWGLDSFDGLQNYIAEFVLSILLAIASLVCFFNKNFWAGLVLVLVALGGCFDCLPQLLPSLRLYWNEYPEFAKNSYMFGGLLASIFIFWNLCSLFSAGSKHRFVSFLMLVITSGAFYFCFSRYNALNDKIQGDAPEAGERPAAMSQQQEQPDSSEDIEVPNVDLMGIIKQAK